MKKIVYLIVGLFLLSSFGAIGIGEKAGVQEKILHLQFHEPDIIANEDSCELHIEGANARLYHGGEPLLPMYTETITLPFGVTITDINCVPGNVQQIMLSDKIQCAPDPVIKGMEQTTMTIEKNPEIYQSDEMFPVDWFTLRVGVGLDEHMNHKTFVNLRLFPARYNPIKDTLYYVNTLDITIQYKKPQTTPFTLSDEYDLVIIAPEAFSSNLQQLVDHKNDYGVATILKTTEAIYDEYTGVDKPEQIKYFIKDAIEEWDISYVLLVGGLNSCLSAVPRDDRNQGTEDWYLPVRYTNLRDSGDVYDPGTISDLYYADIYENGGNFSSWDSNDDGIFAAWGIFGVENDEIDLYPDVAIGRLACRNNFEVKLVVRKIIKYESSASGSSWYNKIIGIGGDSFDDAGTDYLEGEVVADKVLDEIMTDFDPVKIYASNQDTEPTLTPIAKNIVREISKGAGHVLFDGHANPASFNTHWPGDFETWTGGIQIYSFPFIFNGGKLPVVCVEGCHNSQFNVSIVTTMRDKDNSNHMWCHGMMVPECWSWWLVRKIGGGSIATLGMTGLGYGAVGEHGDLDGDGNNEPDILEALGGYLWTRFYMSFDDGADILGETWKEAISRYLDTFPGMEYQTDAKTVQQCALLGDPSLQIGGYP